MFDKNGLYLATKKIGKNNPKAEQITADNELRTKWNREVDRAIVSEVPEADIRQIKQEWITERIKRSFELFNKHPYYLTNIIILATYKLPHLITKVLEVAEQLKEKLFAESLAEKSQINPNAVTISSSETTIEPILPMPVMPPDAAAYSKLNRIKSELDAHNRIIFDAERERGLLEIARSNLKGISRLAKKRV